MSNKLELYSPVHAKQLVARHYGGTALDVASNINSELQSLGGDKQASLRALHDELAKAKYIEGKGLVLDDEAKETPYADLVALIRKAKQFYTDLSQPLIKMLRDLPDTAANKHALLSELTVQPRIL